VHDDLRDVTDLVERVGRAHRTLELDRRRVNLFEAQLAVAAEAGGFRNLRVVRIDLRLQLALRLHRVLARDVADAHRREAGERLRPGGRTMAHNDRTRRIRAFMRVVPAAMLPETGAGLRLRGTRRAEKVRSPALRRA